MAQYFTSYIVTNIIDRTRNTKLVAETPASIAIITGFSIVYLDNLPAMSMGRNSLCNNIN